MNRDINESIGRLTRKIIAFDCIILLVLTSLVMAFSSRSKQRLAEQFSEAFRTPLMAGDNRQIMLDMARPVSMDFIGFAWEPQNPSASFSVPEELGRPNHLLYQSAKVGIFFDESRSIKAGSVKFYYNRWAPVPAALASWLFLVILSITAGYYERKRMLREYALSLESGINESKANLAAQVAHDIRSPLTALDAVLNKTDQLPEKQRVMVRHAVNRIRDIANNLLEKNRQQVKAAPVAGSSASATGEPQEVRLLSSLIDPVITEKRLQFESKPGVNIDFELTRESYGLFARIQPVEFRRMVSNLVNNAVEAVESHKTQVTGHKQEGPKGEVTISLSSEDGKVILAVKDSGQGILPEILAKLGQRGETHGKASGSGLGLFHARTTAESWSGSLVITSELGKGTTVTIKLPKTEAPEGFVPMLELSSGRPVVVLDDDESIHQVWQGRFSAKPTGGSASGGDSIDAKEHDIEVIHFSEPDKLREWVKNNTAKAETAVYLFDYELLGYKETGLGLTEELNLCGRTILVTSRCEEKRIIDECKRLKVRMIPKGLADFVPIKIGARGEGLGKGENHDIPSVSASSPAAVPSAGMVSKPAFAVLIDDDALVRMNWEATAEEAGVDLKIFSEPGGFLSKLESFPKDTPIYIDSELGENIRGENIAVDLREKGFTNITLETGHSPERFAHLPWLKVIDKESPWKS